jgi:hypothetical protein
MAVTACAAMLSACASSSSEISAAYVSPITYDNYSCTQLSAELQRISVRVHEVSGNVDHNHTMDAVAMGVGVVLFWPALLMVKGDGASAAELSSLKGQYDAIEQQGIQKQCGFQTQAAR